jgi:hypothetical protein
MGLRRRKGVLKFRIENLGRHLQAAAAFQVGSCPDAPLDIDGLADPFQGKEQDRSTKGEIYLFFIRPQAGKPVFVFRNVRRQTLRRNIAYIYLHFERMRLRSDPSGQKRKLNFKVMQLIINCLYCQAQSVNFSI